MAREHTQFKITHTHLFLSLLAVTTVALLLAAQISTAADQYTFTLRGDVMQVDASRHTIKVYARSTSSAGENDLGGHVTEINVKPAKYFKYDSTQRKVRTTLGALSVGDEVVILGAKKSGGNYNANIITRNDHRVKLRGTVEGHDVANNILKVEIDKVLYESTGKAYKPGLFKTSQVIWVYYDEDSTKFVSRDNTTMEEDQIANNSERVTVEKVDVRYGGRFVAGPDATITDNKWKF